MYTIPITLTKEDKVAVGLSEAVAKSVQRFSSEKTDGNLQKNYVTKGWTI